MDLNEAYEAYRSNPCDETMEMLYPQVREKVTRVVGKVTRRIPDEDLVVGITTDVLMDIGSFNPKASKFSTWVENAARHDLIDELRKLGPVPPVIEEPLAFQSYAFDKRLDGSRNIEKAQQDVDDSLVALYERVETVLEDEDQELLRLRNAGYTTDEIAELVGLPSGTIRRKFFEIVSKLRVSNA